MKNNEIYIHPYQLILRLTLSHTEYFLYTKYITIFHYFTCVMYSYCYLVTSFMLVLKLFVQNAYPILEFLSERHKK